MRRGGLDLPPTKVIRSSSLPTVISAPVSLLRREIVAPLYIRCDQIGTSPRIVLNLLGADDSRESGTGNTNEDADYRSRAMSPVSTA